jgi:hypothetical protein
MQLLAAWANARRQEKVKLDCGKSYYLRYSLHPFHDSRYL